jgi:hypothetical protein
VTWSSPSGLTCTIDPVRLPSRSLAASIRTRRPNAAPRPCASCRTPPRRR